MRKKIFALIAAIAVASMLFAGCGDQKTETPEETSVSSEAQVDVSEEQPEAEVDTSAEAEETEVADEGLNVDDMTFEWTDDTELFFNSQWGYWYVYEEDGNGKFVNYDILDDADYTKEELKEKELRDFVLTGDPGYAKEKIEIIEEIIAVYFSDDYSSVYNTDDEIAKQWCPWNKASYTDGTVTYEMTLSEEDEAVHARKIENGEMVEEYDTETSIKLARKIIKDLIPEVTVE